MLFSVFLITRELSSEFVRFVFSSELGPCYFLFLFLLFVVNYNLVFLFLLPSHNTDIFAGLVLPLSSGLKLTFPCIFIITFLAFLSVYNYNVI